MGKCSKDKRDVFYRLAKEEGWRARSAFKLLQIEEQFQIFKGVTRAVDLCAAPGSWSQVLAKRLSENTKDTKPKIIAVDIQTMAPLDGVIQIQGDITNVETADKVISLFEGDKAQLIVCDGAPDVTGQHDLDEFIQQQLLLAALNISTFIIEEGGTFVAKIFRGKDVALMITQLRMFFEQVLVVKPQSSRTSSIEAFVVCLNFALPTDYEPHMFSILSDRNCDEHYARIVANGGRTNAKIPFLICGDLNGLDPDRTYSLDSSYKHIDPIQSPIDPPYKKALELQQQSSGQNQKE